MKRKKRNKTPKQRLIDDCFAAFQRIVIERDAGRCQRCGGNHMMAVHHVVRQSQSKRLQVDPVNGLCLCRDCHCWWHSDDGRGRDWFDERWRDRNLYLRQRLKDTTGKTITAVMWQDIYDELKNWDGSGGLILDEPEAVWE